MNRRPGVVTAFVSQVDAGNGRVQLEYRAMEDDLQSAWAPIAAPMSGCSRGQLFMPEVGDECLVAFENGDFNHPFVVGFLWNGQDNSPESEASNRVIVTPGGHQLRFEDKKQDTRIILRSEGKHELLLEDALDKPKAQLKSNGGRHLLLDDTTTGKAELASTSHRITLDDNPGATKIEINAGMGVVTISLNATPVPSLSIRVGGNVIDISAAAMNVTAAGNLSITTGGAATISTGGSAAVTAGGAVSVTAGGAVSVTAGGAISLTASAVSVNSAVATFSGAVVASSIVSPLYTPGVGNIW